MREWKAYFAKAVRNITKRQRKVKVPNKLFAFTTRYDRKVRELISPVHLVVEYEETNRSDELKQYNALWDTGATGSVITSRVVAECNLKPIGKTKVNGVHGGKISSVYVASIGLPNKLIIPKVKFVEVDAIAHADVIIGMDIITLGDFTISNFDNKTHLTFRIPSKKHVNYETTKRF